MAQATIDRLIVNSPYAEPQRHWHYDRGHASSSRWRMGAARRAMSWRRKAPKPSMTPASFVEIPLVNKIRPRIKDWREAGYPGVTSITKRLLEHWQDPEEFDDRRFYFCQLEAIETLIWLTEAPASERVGIDIPGDGGAFLRRCCKMATGSGKTLVMAMAIAWHILNKVANPQDTHFSKNVLVVAPGLTVRKRLEVLQLTAEGNYYSEFNIVPSDMLDKLRQGRVLVRNWHALAWESAEQLKRRRSVDKRGPISDEALHARCVGRDGERQQPAGHQRRSAPRLAHQHGGRGQVPALARPERQRRGGHRLDWRA